jgi:hypothetical protein
VLYVGMGSSSVRCAIEPMPALPMLSLRCLASAMKSASVAAGKSFLASSTMGVVATSMTGSKSVRGS